jgi:hypothetical protein
MQEIPESVQKPVDAISAELRLLPNLEEVTHGTSVLLPNATKLKSGCLQVVENMVDLVGIEPTTSSMPWNSQNRILLTAKTLIVGRVGKNG